MYILLGFLLGAVFAAMAFKPLTTWKITEGWAYKNREANEPSDIALGLSSVFYGALAIVCIGGGFVFHGQQSRAEKCKTAESAWESHANPDAMTEKAKKLGLTVVYKVDQTSSIKLHKYVFYRNGSEIATGMIANPEKPSPITSFTCA